MKKTIIALAILVAVAPALLADGFSQKKSYAGPVLGFGDHELMLGGQYEYGLSQYVGLGALGGISWENYTDYWGEYGYTFFFLGCQCNYHFIQVKGWDPFLGGVLGYEIVSFHESLYPGYTHPVGWSHTSSELVPGVNAGANFKIGKTTYAQARLGYPFYLSGGLLFKF